MNHRWTLFLTLLGITGGALAFRVVGLSERPFHGDEAIHAYKFGELLETGRFVYDPNEYHGPTLHYFTLPVAWITGKGYLDSTEATYRIVPAIFGAGLVLLLWLVRDGLGRWGAIWAGILTAVSTAMVFYSRYYIQETLLVFFTFAVIACGWRYLRSGRAGWAVAAAAAVAMGLAHATKETWVIAGACAGVALGIVGLWRWAAGESVIPPHLRRWKTVFVVPGALVVGAMVAALFFSNFLIDLREKDSPRTWRQRVAAAAEGPLNSVRTYQTYLHRGTKTADHDHPWYYYLDILTRWQYGQPGLIEGQVRKWQGDELPARKTGRAPVWSEGLILVLAVVGMVAAFVRRRHNDRGTGGSPVPSTESTGEPPVLRCCHSPWLLRFLAVYTLGMILFYAAIPYKTPWCMLGFLHGLILLAGVGAAALVRWMKYAPIRVLMALLLLAGAGQLGWQAYRNNYIFYADERLNPLLYSHPGKTIRELIQRLEDLARVHPQGHKMLVQVFASGNEYWPLPYYWRGFELIGFSPRISDTPDSDVVIVSDDLAGELNAKLKGRYAHPDYFGLRPGKVLMVYVKSDLWDAFLRTRGTP